MTFKKLLEFIETRVPSIIAAPIFMILEMLLLLFEFILNIDKIFKPMSTWDGYGK